MVFLEWCSLSHTHTFPVMITLCIYRQHICVSALCKCHPGLNLFLWPRLSHSRSASTRRTIFQAVCSYFWWTLRLTHTLCVPIYSVLFLVVQIPLRHLPWSNLKANKALSSPQFRKVQAIQGSPTVETSCKVLLGKVCKCTLTTTTTTTVADNSYQMCWCTEFSEPLWHFYVKEECDKNLSATHKLAAGDILAHNTHQCQCRWHWLGRNNRKSLNHHRWWCWWCYHNGSLFSLL